MSTEEPIVAEVCVRCGGTLVSMGVQEFRTGGSSGAMHLVFGDWAELAEDLLSFEILACKTCRRAEFRIPRAT